jgi:hypothetical protein
MRIEAKSDKWWTNSERNKFLARCYNIYTVHIELLQYSGRIGHMFANTILLFSSSFSLTS